jgi:hypothetical protein
MDPNANLAEQEEIITRDRVGLTAVYAKPIVRLTELRKALREWLHKDGFEPDWSKAPNARKYYGR